MSLSPDRLPASQAAPATSSAPSSASGAFAIETHGLSKHFGKRTAVDGLTMNVPAGTKFDPEGSLQIFFARFSSNAKI